MKGTIIAAAAAALGAVTVAKAAEQNELPVSDRSLQPRESVKGDNCNVAVVSGLRPERQLLVRSGPGPSYPVIGRLAGGTSVFTCNEASRLTENGGRRWLGLAFAGPGKSCAKATAAGLDIQRSVDCHTGWVAAEWVTIISG
jgi:hypothetical protein